METVNDVIKGVLNSFLDVKEDDKVVHVSLDDTNLISTAIEDSLRVKGFIK